MFKCKEEAVLTVEQTDKNHDHNHNQNVDNLLSKSQAAQCQQK